jgi:hypothetical protein
MIPQFISKVDGPSPLPMPPAYFRPAKNVSAVHIIPYVPGGRPPTPAQAAGIRYEEKWHMSANLLWGADYQTFSDRQFSFACDTGWRVCRPDGILFMNRVAFVFEVKIRHTADAWWQLHHLYIPVLQRYDGRFRYIPVEVSKNFDPQVMFPGTTAPIDMVGLEGELPGVDTLLLSWKGK